ncbi:MAG: hypothetical protein VBE63_17495 [Lamprobacter sp.]|uniref:hypothetical protein n=1 Tax=Lamprobacter sp. TaxID=3100796 RepID=UPI002B256F7F|nr:hypothetical protein [Lamprobacter sp.]MEA3641712.1 hypothetical protein [Lamprobacter sp.]
MAVPETLLYEQRDFPIFQNRKSIINSIDADDSKAMSGGHDDPMGIEHDGI